MYMKLQIAKHLILECCAQEKRKRISCARDTNQSGLAGLGMDPDFENIIFFKTLFNMILAFVVTLARETHFI